MSEEYFLKVIHKHRYYILLFMLIGAGAGFVFSRHNAMLNSAVSTIFITPQPELELQSDIHGVITQNSVSSREAFAVQQMYLLSNEMDLAIVRRFNLYKHYRIDSTSTYAYEKIVAILHKQMELKPNLTISLFELSFKDADADFAVNLINFTVSKLQQMNKAAVVDRLKEKIQLYKLMLSNINDQSAKISDRLADQIKAFNEIVKSSKFDQREYENLLSFQNSLVSLTTDLKSVNQSLVSANNIYQLAEKSMKDNDFHIVKQIQRALPRPRNPQLSAFAFCSFGIFLALVIYLTLLYFFTNFKSQIRIIFTGA